jgi:VanZ family protein
MPNDENIECSCNDAVEETMTPLLRDRGLLVAALFAFAFWLAAIGPVRTWASGGHLRANWMVGVAPSFFAGATFALWQAFAVRTRPVVSVATASAVVVLAEVAQLFLPRYTADVLDAIAGIIGAVVVTPFLVWRSRRAAGAG